MIILKKFWVLPLLAIVFIDIGLNDYGGTLEGMPFLIAGILTAIAALIYFYRVIIVTKIKKKEMSSRLENGVLFLAVLVFLGFILYMGLFQ